MDERDIIAELAIENTFLKRANKEYTETLRHIKSRLISIGAPLNDNVLKYNNKQLVIFFDILSEIKCVLPVED